MRLSWPLPPEYTTVSQSFGENPERYIPYGLAGHEGWDFPCLVGTPTFATHDGWIDPKWRGEYGDSVRVYGEGFFTFHAHLSRTIGGYGQRVRAGQAIGKTGDTGRSTGPHLHWAIQVDAIANEAYKGWVNPEPYLKERSVTKTSAHIQKIYPWMQQALVDLGSNWVKFVNPPGGPDPMPRIANKIVRIHTDAIDDQFVPRGEQGGRDFVRHMLPQWRERPWATCYSLANEPGCNSPTELDNLNGYSIGAMQEASANGIQLVIFDTPESNPSGGDPYSYEVKRDKLARLAPAVRMATELGHYIGTHAYWRPGIEGPLGEFHALGEVILKHDIWQLLGAYSAEPKFLVTEWGLDGALESNPYEGWRAFVAKGAISERNYIDGLLAAEALAQDKPWLKALFTFTWGFEGQWQSYDHYEGFVRNLVMAMHSLPMPPVEPPVEPIDQSFTPFEQGRAKVELQTLPATMKAANAAGYVWLKEWELGGFYFALVYSLVDHSYRVLKLESRAMARGGHT